jgi:CxxC-x17-CxxC domain-containing protein
MSLSDVTLYCITCNQPFAFTIGQQQFYASKNLTNIPNRCPTCQSRHKSRVDQTLTCVDCNQPFVFTVGEQEFYEKRNIANTPTRCPACRERRKSEPKSSASVNATGQPRQMYSAFCTQCGTQTQVPFQPKPGRAIYCRTCYQAQRKSSYKR